MLKAADQRPSDEARSSSVTIQNVGKDFGSFRALDDVSMSIRSGEFFTLLGPSGSGKTTLLHLLAGFQQPDSGHIELAGRRISGLPPFRREIGMAFQSYALFSHLSVFENVAFPLRVRRTPRVEIEQRVAEALDMVRLSGMAHRRIHQLSGGQQQRVALARAFVFRPRLLLMDEPLSALDAKLRVTMQRELVDLQRRLGITVVYVTHDQQEALALSDRIAVLKDGKVEQLDSPAVMYERPASRFIADFLGEASIVEATVAARRGDRVSLDVGGAVVEALDPSGAPIGSRCAISVRPERLELNGGSESNRISGRVTGWSYGGNHSMLAVALGDGQSLKVQLAAGETAAPPIGQAVTLGWAPEHGVVLYR